MTFLIILCNYFLVWGGFASSITLSLFLSTRMFLLCTKIPIKFLAKIPNVHLVEFIFNSHKLICFKACSNSNKWLWNFINVLHVINIKFHTFSNEIVEYGIHAPWSVELLLFTPNDMKMLFPLRIKRITLVLEFIMDSFIAFNNKPSKESRALRNSIQSY